MHSTLGRSATVAKSFCCNSRLLYIYKMALIQTQMERQPVEFLMKCMTDVAMGMHYLSEKGLIHRVSLNNNVLF